MTTKPSSSRRKFLATLGVGGAAAAAAAAALTQQGGKPGPSIAQTTAPLGKGYQLTDHVRNYYRTTKV